MIARALRDEIDRHIDHLCCDAVTVGSHDTLGQGEVTGQLVALLETTASATVLAFTAYLQSVAALKGAPWVRASVDVRCAVLRGLLDVLGDDAAGCRWGMERALDEVDARVDDPCQLPAIRDSLRRLIRLFEVLCQRTTRDERTGSNASAA